MKAIIDLDGAVGDPLALVTDFAAVIEAAYAPATSDADWLRRIVAVARGGLDRGGGLVGCLFRVEEAGVAVPTVVMGAGAVERAPALVAETYLPVLVERAAGAPGRAVCATVRAALPGGAGACAAIVALAGIGQTRLGCALLAPLPRAAGVSRGSAAVWSRGAQHLSAGLGLRAALGEEDSMWRGLISGRWDLVDHFDVGGRRVVIARRRRVAGRPQAARLSDRERAACARAARGLANKVIAAELGVAVSTVGMLLLRATRKLRCGSREELIRAFRAVEEPWPDDQPGRPRAPATRDRAPLGQ